MSETRQRPVRYRRRGALGPSVMLGEEAIRIWHGPRFTNIGIGDVAGAGMLFTHIAGYGGYWRLYTWRDDGTAEPTSFSYGLYRNPGHSRARGQDRWNWSVQATYDPVAASELPALSASRAAKVTRDITERVLAAQGPEGQLATRHLERAQRTVRVARTRSPAWVVAYWGGDGTCGRCG